jgi:hypothetical protein
MGPKQFPSWIQSKEKIMKFKDIKGQSKCDNGHIFDSNKAKLEPWSTHIKIFGVTHKFVDKNGTICSGSDPLDTDFALCCPICERVHMFGFDSWNEKNSIAKKDKKWKKQMALKSN